MHLTQHCCSQHRCTTLKPETVFTCTKATLCVKLETALLVSAVTPMSFSTSHSIAAFSRTTLKP